MRLLLLMVFIISCSSKTSTNNYLNIIPSIETFGDNNDFSNINPNDIEYAYSSENDKIPITYGYLKNITFGDLQNALINFKIDNKIDLKSEGYILNIEKEKIFITAKDNAGLFYAFITLNQILENAFAQKKSVPILNIKDQPSLDFRPIHLDLKHHTEKQSYYFDLIDYLANLKINGIIVELEDKLKYVSRPEIGSSDSFSIEWWIELSDYAKSRNIIINPLVQGLGHASFILKHEKNIHLRDKPESDWAFNPLNPETYELQFDLYLDAIKATPHGKYLHIGGDEVRLVERDNKTELELNLIWLNKVCEFAEKHGRVPIFWDDMPLKHAGVYNPMFDDKISEKEVDEIWNKNEINLMNFIEKFPKNAVYMRWNYQKSDTYGNLKAMDWYSNNELTVMGATAGQTRWTLMPQNQSNIPQIKSFASSSVDKKLDGLLLTLWDDDSPHFELYKRGIAAFAQYSWSGNSLPIKEFKKLFRIKNFGFQFGKNNYAFIDLLEKPVGMWLNMLLSENGWRPGLSKKQNPLASDIIDLPNLDKKGEWSKKHKVRINDAKRSLEISLKVETIINLIQGESQNPYLLEIYSQVNELTKFSSDAILKLEKVDFDGDIKHIKNLESEFNSMRNEFERIYSKSRILNKPDDYILDQDHHHHPANQTLNFDWQFLSEILLIKKIKETYKI
ncbi:beta-N-acetylhexosaminidase [Flavobacteriaceae bacterium]|nr:beta-N-acetylhexosaminidase [Flavobacteriaceae bacterium]MDB4005778.1 beta-N-acetylhexosaminidase [Flavobacteriaceae bacterium]MDB4013764.1 beta-N-acetylhexosaminidase [Flavobacteriaceae bacterium]